MSGSQDYRVGGPTAGTLSDRHPEPADPAEAGGETRSPTRSPPASAREGEMPSKPELPQIDWLTEADVLAAHAQFGRLDWHMVKKGMGPNWPAHWEQIGPGDGIFEPDEEPRP